MTTIWNINAPGYPLALAYQKTAKYQPPGFSWLPFACVLPDPLTGAPWPYLANGLTKWDVSTYKVTGGTTYYVSNSASNGYVVGNDGNNGLTKGAAFASFAHAYSVAASGSTIYVNPGTYHYLAGTQEVAISKSINIIGDGGVAVFDECLTNPNTWALTSGATHTYQTSASFVADAWDAGTLDAYGDYAHLTLAGSFAGTGDLAAGQWFISGGVVYVRTTDSRNLTGSTSNIRLYVSAETLTVLGAVTVYMENIAAEGHGSSIQTTAGPHTPTVYLKNCRFSYGGLFVAGATVYSQGCTANQAANDGFAYHAGSGVICHVVEVNFTGRNNGWSGPTDTSNSTTGHDASFLARIGGESFGSQGPNVIDIGGCTTWIVGHYAHGSAGGVGANSDFVIDGTMWLDGCITGGSTWAMSSSASGSILYTRAHQNVGAGTINKASGASVLAY